MQQLLTEIIVDPILNMTVHNHWLDVNQFQSTGTNIMAGVCISTMFRLCELEIYL